MVGCMQDSLTIKSGEEGLEWANWPNVEYPHIFSINYCKQLKAYKSLEGYKYFVDGWWTSQRLSAVTGYGAAARFGYIAALP